MEQSANTFLTPFEILNQILNVSTFLFTEHTKMTHNPIELYIEPVMLFIDEHKIIYEP